ncbi:MAG TPA: TIGR03620 family F420-dependent LLM class oxidoreductase [Acidimicrobiales bacterium]|nr:TIGR03620 family F420-dependent LLM class oxidoreductase [Acidimicrobiales bacterium]
MDLGRIGIWWSGWQPDDGIVEAAQDIEDAGYGAIWLSGGFRPGLSKRFERLLASSESLIVASGIINTWFTPAAELASAVAGLEERFPGRFLLGLGVSHAPVIDGSGFRYERPVEQMVGFLDGLDGAEPSVPADRRALAALGRRMLRISAERSLGAHPYFVPVEHTTFAREVLGQGPLLAPEVAVVLESDASAARDAARAYMSGYLGLPNYANNLRRLGYAEEDVSGGASDRLVDDVVPWGPVARVADRIREHLDAGADHVCVQIVGADQGFPAERYRELAGELGLA